MSFRSYWIPLSYHEKLMTLSMVSTPDKARVTRALSSAHLAVPRREKKLKISFNIYHNHSSIHKRYMYSQLPTTKPHLKEKDALA